MCIKDPTALTDELGEQVQQKHIEKLILVQIVLDHFDGNSPIRKAAIFHKFWQKTQSIRGECLEEILAGFRVCSLLTQGNQLYYC